MIGENGPPLEGWRLPSREPVLPPRCCGTFAASKVCGVCGNWLSFDGLGDN